MGESQNIILRHRAEETYPEKMIGDVLGGQEEARGDR